MLYRIMAMLVLILFYATYFLKALIQKRQGIQTRQIGKHKEKDIHTVEILMPIATLCAPIVQLISILLNWTWMPTATVETVCLLVNQNAKAKQHVKVGIDAEEYYRVKKS